MYRVSCCIPTRPGTSRFRAMLRQLVVRLSPLPISRQWRSEESGNDLQIQNGGVFEEHAARKQRVHGNAAANARFVNRLFLFDWTRLTFS